MRRGASPLGDFFYYLIGQKLGQIEDSYWDAIEEVIAVELAIFGR